ADNAQGPLLWLTVTGTDAGSVLASDKILAAYAGERLKEFQERQSVDPEAMIRMTTIVPPQKPVAQSRTRLQYLVMAGGLGLVLSLVAAFYVEARNRPPSTEPGERAREATAPEPAVDETLAVRRPPSWSRPAESAAAQPEAPQPVMAASSATEPLDEEPAHGHRPRTGQ
ncbi:chain length determinant protein, partial [Streptomyces sp. TRM76130]|nr:chain length determinant protein [Streptomyces sp. TRM76130]